VLRDIVGEHQLQWKSRKMQKTSDVFDLFFSLFEGTFSKNRRRWCVETGVWGTSASLEIAEVAKSWSDVDIRPVKKKGSGVIRGA
jgi:hypothetical protein